MMLAITTAMLTSYKNPYCLHAKPSNMQKSILITSRKSDNLRNLDSRISMKKNILSNIYAFTNAIPSYMYCEAIKHLLILLFTENISTIFDNFYYQTW
jgi:hypothetical protein